MPYGFELGRIYNRRQDIHGRFGGQQQGGIITPANHPLVIIISGNEGQQHGYADREMPDGSFQYFGEGQRGDMTLSRGNAGIAETGTNGKSLLLFRKEPDGVRFDGEWVYAGHHIERAPDTTGALRDAIVFELTPLESVTDEMSLDAAAPIDDDDLPELWRRAFLAARPVAARGRAERTIYERSRDVAIYVTRRADGACEGCAQPAPFRRANGEPYLEPHHIRRVSDGGPDDPRFVIALCPTCHRRVHHADDGARYNDTLLDRMPTIEVGRA